MRRLSLFSALVFTSLVAQAQEPPRNGEIKGAPETTKSAEATPKAETVVPEDGSMRSFLLDLKSKKIVSQDVWSLESIRRVVGSAEQRRDVGQSMEAAATLLALVEDDRFEPFKEDEEARAAFYALGDSLLAMGAGELGRTYLRSVLRAKNAWGGNATYARRSFRRLVEDALEREHFDELLPELTGASASLPEELRWDLRFLEGRAKEAKGENDSAIASYAQISESSRFWGQAQYRSGLIEFARGNTKQAENFFCKVADPNKQSKTAAIFGGQRFFAVRDLARLALGRLAHESKRNDDARYYYYLVPNDSNRLAEALHEAATTRYEKKDFEGAEELLGELKKIPYHSYQDEALVLEAYIQLGRCRFKEADDALKAFLARYEPLREVVRHVANDHERAKTYAREASLFLARPLPEAGLPDDAASSIRALLRVDPSFARVDKQRQAVADHLVSLNEAPRVMAMMREPGREIELQTRSGSREETLAALAGLSKEISDLRAAKASESETAALQQEMWRIQDRLRVPAEAMDLDSPSPRGKEDPDLVVRESARAESLASRARGLLGDLDRKESELAKNAFVRLEERFSRLLRRARLGRVETVLGRKRSLEVEVEALNDGFIPDSSLDALKVQRVLRDDEEYWPFEGDDWPDEFIGSEKKDDPKPRAKTSETDT